ncbi:MAG: O-antigen ligase family protein, partial [Chloroflexi bacterium]|nr:O-antigen ligase family protein [Chloroflexota bacterium]
ASAVPIEEQVSALREVATKPAEIVIVPPPPGAWALRLVPSDTLRGIRFQKGFFTLTGRTAVWAQGWQLLKLSPLFGFGFHADRLLLDGQHMHNAVMHALVQTGLIGTIPFVGAFLWGWILLFKALRNLARLPAVHKQLVIQAGGVLAFLSLRAIPESTGAFFGVDWLLLAPLLLYLQVVNYAHTGGKAPA